MKTSFSNYLKEFRFAVFAIITFTFATANGAEMGKTFRSPEEAANALAAAAAKGNREELRAIFGPASEDLQNPDSVAAENDMAAFSAAFAEAHRIVPQSDKTATLEIGQSWPFPIPLAQRDGRWFFDTDAGKEELLNRRIGRNELSTLGVVRAYVDAQREYSGRDRDGDEVLEYAQNILSTPGQKDGLYWSPALDGELSPLGPMIATAYWQGYRKASGEKSGPQPFNGYYFKVLTSQGPHAPGGEYNYVINGNMIGGFGLIAWPAEYANSGVMTFMVNQQGKVYQKDLGEKTASAAREIAEYDPDKTWMLSPE